MVTPDVFGPCMWATIHYICLGSGKTIEPSKQQALRQFFRSLPDIIPCKKCGEHLAENLTAMPVDQSLGSSDDLFKWSVELHNIVNKQLGKKFVSLDEAKNIWAASPNLYSPKNESRPASPSVQKVCIFFIIGVIIGIALQYALSRLF